MFKIIQEIHVEWGHCDPAGIVFNPNFFTWMDNAQEWLLATAAPEFHNISHEQSFVGTPLVSSKADFKNPARHGDLMELHSQIAKLGSSSFTFKFKFIVGDTLIADCEQTRVWACRLPNDPENFAASPIPKEVRDKLQVEACYRFVQTRTHDQESD